MSIACEEIRELAPAFVLGALDEGGRRTVQDHLASCPEVHEEFAALGGVVAHLAESVDLVEPPATLRTRVLAAAAADLEARLGTRPAAPGAARVVSSRPAPRQWWRGWALRPAWVANAAAVLAIVVLGAWNLGLRAELSDAQAYRQHADEVLAISRTRGASVAILVSPVAGANSGLIAVGADGRAAALVSGLPPTSGSQVYELWVIAGSNPPLPVGAMTQAGAVTFLSGTTAPVPSGATVALTLEPAADPTTPTLPIVSKGVAGASS